MSVILVLLHCFTFLNALDSSVKVLVLSWTLEGMHVAEAATFLLTPV